jgi:response regulator RpfG family c-di-GMP phosphodiesterase
MASDRAYRKRMEEDVILKIIHEGAGTQFDPVVVAVFKQVYDQGTILRYMQSGQLDKADLYPPIKN